MSNTITIRHDNDEFLIRFERRRYSNVTYTWAEVKLGDYWISLGDPWPCITPKRTELADAAVKAISFHYAKANGDITQEPAPRGWDKV